MQETEVYEITLYRSVWLYFIPYSEAEKIILADEMEKTIVNFGFAFDYEKIKAMQWKLHLDIMLDVLPVGKICTRTSFEIGATAKEVFSPETFALTIAPAIDKCINAFAGQSQEHDIVTVKINPEHFKTHIAKLSDGASLHYWQYRKSDDTANKNLMKPGVTFTPGYETHLALTGTFMILDEVMFLNPKFYRDSNQKEIAEVMPMSRYFTLKLNIMDIATKKVKLNWLATTQLLIYVDLALQLLVGDHYDTLAEGLDVAGLDGKIRQVYISYCSNMLAQIKDSLQSSGARFLMLEKEYDWNALIR